MKICDLCQHARDCHLEAPEGRDECRSFRMEGTLSVVFWLIAFGPLALCILLVAAMLYGG